MRTIATTRVFALSVFIPLCAAAAPALAADTWTDPAPGVRQLVRTTASPNRIVATVIDLSRPDLYIRATKPGERGKTTTSWANSVGAVVAINGDWFGSGYQPTGLAVGDGEHWSGTADTGWSFIACTVEKNCVFDDHTTNIARYHLWHEVVGGNGWRLMVNGAIPTYPNDAFYTTRNPRSGVGLSADGKTMIIAAVEGRRGDSIGMGFRDFAMIFQELGAHNALMLDGGGSTALVVNGARQNRLPSSQGSERVVANHLGIVRGTASAQCNATPNGRYCDGSVIHTCRGGQHMGQGDCGAFGASCEVTSEGIGTCVHPHCTGGANGKYCEDETRITTCDNGAPGSTGDCAAYGATCETDADDAYCVHYLCTEGGSAEWCRDDATLGACVDGQPLDDVDCTAAGKVCSEGACIDPATPVNNGGSTNNTGAENNVPGGTNSGTTNNDNGSTNSSGGDGGATNNTGGGNNPTDGGDPSGTTGGTGSNPGAKATCASAGSAPSLLALLLGLFLTGRARRRR